MMCPNCKNALSHCTCDVRETPKKKQFYFNITLSGYGETADEAYMDAIEAFSDDPGITPEYEVMEYETYKRGKYEKS